MKYHKNQGIGLFDKENTLQELLENGNPLPKLKEIIDFEQFRNILEPVFENRGRRSTRAASQSILCLCSECCFCRGFTA